MHHRPVLAALALGALAVPVAPAVAKTKLVKLPDVKAKITKIELADIGPAGESVGDMQVFTLDFFDAKTGAKAGTGHGYCVRTQVGKAGICNAVATFANGKDSLYTRWEDIDTRLSDPGIVVGGTGIYAGARGVSTVIQDNANDLLNYTVKTRVAR